MTILNLLPQLVEQGWVYKLANTPLLVFRSPMTKLLTAIRTILVQKVAVANEFDEWLFPRLVPEEVLSKTGWLTFHREEAWRVSTKREHVFDRFRLDEADDGDLFRLQDRFPSQPLPYALDPIQCVSFYYALYGQRLDEADLPMRVFEYQGGWTHRYETDPDGLIRGLGFLRLELIWIGTRKHAEDVRVKVLSSFIDTLSDQLYIDACLGISDSCFEESPGNGYDPKNIRKLSEVKEIPSVDVLWTYPEPSTYLELASAGRHEKLPRRFNIVIKTQPNGETKAAWSGCLGIGLTRVAAAFLLTHGLQPDAWPREFKGLFGRM